MPKIYKRHCNYCKKYYEGRGKFFCSWNCFGKAHIGKNNPVWNSTKRICEICKKEFFLPRAWINKRGKRGRFCSTKCMGKWRSLYFLGKNNLMYNKKRPDVSERFKGNKNYFWKGGVTQINILLRNSQQYKLWRRSAFERDNYTCQSCGKEGHVEVHHIKPFSINPELRFEISNGITLCKDCHKKVHKDEKACQKYL